MLDDSLKIILEQMDDKMDMILSEVRKTNGRVTVSENNIGELQQAHSRLKGAFWMLGVVFTIITTLIGIFKK